MRSETELLPSTFITSGIVVNAPTVRSAHPAPFRRSSFSLSASNNPIPAPRAMRVEESLKLPLLMLKCKISGRFSLQIMRAEQASEGVIKMVRAKMPKVLNQRHLCFLEDFGFMEPFFEGYKGLVKNPTFVCRKCGRAAGKGENLCTPERLWINSPYWNETLC